MCLFEQIEIEGLTGNISFNDQGKRTNFTLNVVEMNILNEMVKIADWSDDKGLLPVAQKQYMIHNKTDNVFDKNRTFIVTTIIEEPYIMLKTEEEGKPLAGNERFEGYCKDLADLIADRLGINCKFVIYF